MLVTFNDNTYDLYTQRESFSYYIRAKWNDIDFIVVSLNKFNNFNLEYRSTINKEHYDLIQDLFNEFAFYKFEIRKEINSMDMNSILTDFFEYYKVKTRENKISQIV